MKAYVVSPYLVRLSCLIVLSTSGLALGQGGSFRSESERFLDSFRGSVSTDQIVRRTVEPPPAVRGFGVPSVRTPLSIGIGSSQSTFSPQAIAPAPRRSATFGVGTAGGGEKPFANITRDPTVSPYLNLFREDLSGESDLNYQTLVQPQLRQQEFNRQVNREAQQINRRLNALSARNAFNVQGNANQPPTGHAAGFQNYSRFYPAAANANQRRGR